MSLADAIYRATTHGFDVEVAPQYQPTHSDPSEGRWVWSYHVTIRNRSDRPARLLSRYWQIVDAEGREEIVQGPGVVGQTPRIEPGDSFEYHSGCPLPTPSGTMGGHYEMRADSGDTFRVDIPAFALEVPGGRRTLN